ncbi:hypothetical protein GGS20DRAFT_567119 [Poronia punctata]|nr:hypothetical protein GGS20DRAFT_567119 [Poronia punctata]
MLQFALRYMKEKLEQLAHECDQGLEREFIPGLVALLREIDLERHNFEQHKRDAARDLWHQLRRLGSDATAIDDAIDCLYGVTPRYFALLPTASSIIEASLSAHISPSGAADGAAIVDSRVDESAPMPPPSAPTPKPKPAAAAVGRSMCDQISRQTAEKHVATCSNTKRPVTEDPGHYGAGPQKRQKAVDEKKEMPKDAGTETETETETERRVAFPNLITGECIFRHAERRGYFVIRCDLCKPGIFTEPPLLYNRALKHFHNHCGTGLQDELTNDTIFERFSWQVDGEEMASKYWVREHLGAVPHTFVPTKASWTDGSSESSLFPEQRDPTRNHQSGHQMIQSRRPLRNVPRPDYAEMVANKDPWDVLEAEESESEIEKPLSTVDVDVIRPLSSSKRRLTKPGVGPRARMAKSKPFGYMDEPWPRRSAPR